ncbi:MAG: glycerate kinase [Aigarchaeota archaeon]|nr:glycerate kinase [Candidatus Geocrenenecus dongiae]
MFKIVKNFEELVNRRRDVLAEIRRDVLRAVEAAIEAVLPENTLKKHVKRIGDSLMVDKEKYSLKNYEKIIVLGAGKAVLGMARHIEEIMLDKIDAGVVVVPREKIHEASLKKIEVLPSTHPIPSMLGVKASEKLLEYAEKTDSKTLVIFLLSGGASALLPMPTPPITLEDKAETTRLLLKSGATIDEINIVRRHISEIKGGKLLRKLNNATVITLIISDVIGDKLEVIGSGPTAPDPYTYRDAYEVLRRYGLWDKVPEKVRKKIEDGMEGKIEENPKPGDPIFNRVRNVIIANVLDACSSARRLLSSSGYRVKILTHHMEGEASEVGRFLIGVAKDMLVKKPSALICGGETTVTVRGHGIGGRNQELALSSSINLKELDKCVLVSVGTDGVDGPTDAAGAIVDNETYRESLEMGLNPIEYLLNNDSYNFFKKLGDHVITGPTGTNVGDIVIIASRG